ncbi:hypothetical protein [Alkalihalobacterium chitinilyticum]|uniref:Uncharacterized protein n=1 Tax=Alkalihalobacterium chitinilyticum TaxID=2980103 RepID=A0ABT5VF87_9BACI|nr:hypothetical protein [Alkalihalobacterium chitinilyticum]MDE5414123.1 hypothetical protein [Alkalihalobacterium chitinilyticum]
MSSVKLPLNFFGTDRKDTDLYKDIYNAFDHQLDEFFIMEERFENTVDYNSFFVPVVILAADFANDIRSIDVIVYAYICYSVHISKRKSTAVKVNVSEISGNTFIKKTNVRQSINILIRERLLEKTDVSGYYLIPDLLVDPCFMEFFITSRN